MELQLSQEEIDQLFRKVSAGAVEESRAAAISLPATWPARLQSPEFPPLNHPRSGKSPPPANPMALLASGFRLPASGF